MDPTDRDVARARLLAERTRLLEEIDEAVALPEQMTYGSQAAAATQVFEQERELAMRERASLHLAGGRRRAGAGSTAAPMGHASDADGPSPAERLEALPWAAHCIDCQTIVDRGRR